MATQKSLLTTLMNGVLSGSGAQALATNSGASNDQVQSVVSSALPLLLQSMASNASDKDGADSLAGALADHAKTDGSLAEQLQNADTEDGAKIIAHLLGGNAEKVETTLAKKNDLSSDQVSAILATLAPALMSSVGKEKEKEEKQSGGLDLSSLLIGLVTGKTPSTSSSHSSGGLDLGGILNFALQDRDGDGQSDVLSILGKLMTGK